MNLTPTPPLACATDALLAGRINGPALMFDWLHLGKLQPTGIFPEAQNEPQNRVQRPSYRWPLRLAVVPWDVVDIR